MSIMMDLLTVPRPLLLNVLTLLILSAGIMWLCTNWKSAIAWVKKRQSEHPLLSFLLTLILGALIYVVLPELLDIVLIQPITESYLHPPIADISIEPMPQPSLTDKGAYTIRVNIVNNGTTTLGGMQIDYKLCNMTKPKRAFLESKTFLRPQDADYFEFEATGINTSCSVSPKPILYKFYRDKSGIEYIKKEQEISKVCSPCQLEINVTTNGVPYNRVYLYPYSEKDWLLPVKVNTNALPYEYAQNKSELIYLSGRDVTITSYDMSTACFRGDDIEWCEKYFDENAPIVIKLTTNSTRK